MFRAGFPRILLAACAAGLLLIVTLTLLGAPTVANAGERPVADAPDQPRQASGAGVLCFVSGGIVSCVDRISIQSTGALTDQVRTLMQALIAGPTFSERAQGVRSSLPADAVLIDVSASPERAVIRLDLPAHFLSTFDAGDAEDVNEQIAVTLTPFNFASIRIEARDPERPGAFRPLSTFLPPVVIPNKPGEAETSSFRPQPSPLSGGQPPDYGNPQASGGLRNKTIFVSAGHGWYWNSTLGQYRTQRPHYPSSPYPAGQGIVEDFNNAEIVNQYLLQYLWNAGADAWTVRERSMITSMHIVDNASPAFSVVGGWSSGSGGYNGTYHSIATVSGSATATATWTFTPTVAAEYAVYVWYPNASNRTAAARYFVDHAGGTTVLTITQQRDGVDWRYIGTYPFRANVVGRVRLTNQSTAAGLNVLADAIRVGGGVGDVAPPGTPPSFKPRWEEQALRYAYWVGVPDAVNLNDVIVRPIFAEWEYEPGEDAIYVSYHSNGYSGYNTTARGTETYIHDFEPTPNSDVLQDYVHAELLADIHSGWEPTWPDRGQKSKDLGELRLLETMPGVLIENGYHDNPTDVEAEKDPRFNLLSARAIYQGIVRYWNSQDANVPLVFLPEPPTHLRVRNAGSNRVTLTWQPGPIDAAGLLGGAATSYRVYTSTDGFGWGNAISTTNTVLTMTGLTPGQLIYVRVSGVNAGGESFPSPVLAARVAQNGVAPVLIVYGFDRIDRHGLIQQFDGAEGNNRRMFLDRINRYDYVIQHATGITLAFDSAVHAAVTDGDVGLGNYAIVDWIGGEEQSPDVALNTTDQSHLQAFLNSGGALLISGAEIGFDLASGGFGPAFYNDTLHATFVADDAGTYGVSVVAGGIFDGLPAFNFDDGTHGTYDADYPDVFTPRAPASSALLYNGGNTAALSYASGPCTRLVYMSFPIETIYPQSTRDALLSRALAFLDDCAPLGEPDTAIASPTDGAAYNSLPTFNGAAGGPGGLSAVQVAILSGTLYYSGTGFVPVEHWLTATGATNWSFALPALTDRDYMLKARAIQSGAISDTTPAAITFTLDTVAPATPAPITPTGSSSIVAIAPNFVWSGGGDLSGFDVELDGVVETLNTPALSVTRAVTEGTHTWRVRAFDRAGNMSNWSSLASFTSSTLKAYLPLLLNNFAQESPSAPNCFEAIDNGDFETTGGWTLNPSAVVAAYVTSPSPVHSGVRSMRSGIDGQTGDAFAYSSFQQSVTIPPGAITATLSFWRFRKSTDTVNDLQMVRVTDSANNVDYPVRERINDPIWSQTQFDLLSSDVLTHSGPITLYFNTINNVQSGTTAMYVDDVSLQICTP